MSRHRPGDEWEGKNAGYHFETNSVWKKPNLRRKQMIYMDVQNVEIDGDQNE